MTAHRFVTSGRGRPLLAAMAVALLVVALPATAGARGKPPGHDSNKCRTGTSQGVWADWMPPTDWTAGQVSYANSLIANTLANSGRLDTPAEAAAAGYVSIGDGPVTGFDHWVKSGLVNDDKILDPCAPESVVFQSTATGPVLVAYMYILPTNYTLTTIPSEIAWLPGWHVHENLCFSTTTSQIVGIADAGGNCPPGSVRVTTPPMTHVWLRDNICHEPWAGVDEGGVMCMTPM